MKPIILYVEDDASLSMLTSDGLEEAGYDLVLASDGKEGLDKFMDASRINLCILDVMLPKMDGFELATKIRENDKEVPILFLTAKGMKEDRIEGLTLGADDYLTKPFSMEELVLKIEVFLKRSSVLNQREKWDTLKFASMSLDPKTRALVWPEGERRLTQKEAQLCQMLVAGKGELVPRESILKTIWGDDDYFLGRSLDVYVSKLRKYLKADTRLEIENIHGSGYILHIHEPT